MNGVSVSQKLRFGATVKNGHVMEVSSVEKVQALKAQQMVAIHDLGEDREMIAVERSADEMDQTGRSTEREFAILGLHRRSQLLRKTFTEMGSSHL
jgi:hypothetical protein